MTWGEEDKKGSDGKASYIATDNECLNDDQNAHRTHQLR